MTMVAPKLPRCALLIYLAFAINLKALNAFQLPTSPEWSTKTTNSLSYPSNRALPDVRPASNTAHATILFYKNPFDSSIDEDPAAEREKGLLVLFSVPLGKSSLWDLFDSFCETSQPHLIAYFTANSVGNIRASGALRLSNSARHSSFSVFFCLLPSGNVRSFVFCITSSCLG